METLTTITQILGVMAMVGLSSWICWILLTAKDDDFHDDPNP